MLSITNMKASSLDSVGTGGEVETGSSLRENNGTELSQPWITCFNLIPKHEATECDLFGLG